MEAFHILSNLWGAPPTYIHAAVLSRSSADSFFKLASFGNNRSRRFGRVAKPGDARRKPRGSIFESLFNPLDLASNALAFAPIFFLRKAGFQLGDLSVERRDIGSKGVAFRYEDVALITCAIKDGDRDCPLKLFFRTFICSALGGRRAIGRCPDV
jgi:hypothetical protein